MDVLARTIEKEFTDAGEIPVGFLYASVKNIGTSDAIVNEVTFPVGEAKDYPFVGKPYEAKTFDPKGSILLVMYVM